MLILGVDTGGTFTDFIYRENGSWGIHKRLSTPENPSKAVIEGIRHICGGTIPQGLQIVHGSTVATNAILERKGVPTALVTNDGFTDVIEIGRQNRAELYNLSYRRQPHIVPSELRFGVGGRFDQDGTEVEPFDTTKAREIAKAIKDSGAESVAVCFLFSFLNASHEDAMRELLGELKIPVSVSHEILSEFREFERTSTTVVNAYVSPKMTAYLTDLKNAVEGSTLRIMQSNGGSISVNTAMQESVRTILSGPAGGAVGALEIGKQAGFDKLITFDMGGTSSDVALLNGELPLTMESSISGYPVKVPMIDIHTVGAGGGSIAALDEGGSLSVGPESAGADPGPICYGKGERITVTDANLYLGRLVAERFLGGDMTLRTDVLNAKMEEMAEQAGLSPVELAEGILDIANTNMERAIRVISVERGFDPREFTMFSFGGAGGMHCVSLARLLNMPRVFIPVNPGILSAVGMLMADVIKDYSRTVMLDQHTTDAAALYELFAPLEAQGENDLKAEGFESKAIRFERFLDMRYQGQSFEIMVPFDDDFIENFEQLHERSYGYRNPGRTVEIVNIRLRARGAAEKPTSTKQETGSATPVPEAISGTQPSVFDGTTYDTPIVEREKLLPGNKIPGPAIVVEYSSTIVIPPYANVTVDAFGNLLIELDNA
ncbi:hydantoinase/oxoprolinase family protein [Desulfobaculum bizertense]|uniref:hydantoinase/oxoprolinase family protein n=1 Tax=Desulfobaculum bizertense TaxID=376490 RepID=UPI001F1A14CC|nr:hydantoinase/oxoprolinase family protein [Desulfobaculum bizertense]UIJ39224.1 hydantoinase/oxoprolinase family protein [Desulfobaculum bizertense]